MIEWDVFISHASEDKAAVARPLADILAASGVTVWLDEAELWLMLQVVSSPCFLCSYCCGSGARQVSLQFGK